MGSVAENTTNDEEYDEKLHLCQLLMMELEELVFKSVCLCFVLLPRSRVLTAMLSKQNPEFLNACYSLYESYDPITE